MTLNRKTVYSNKAETYARYRWDYAPEALAFIFRRAGLHNGSTVADLGAGTEILTRHFPGRVGRVMAVEPNAEMRAILARDLAHFSNVQVLPGCAEATSLADACADLVTAAQAVHWFDPLPARAEMGRILRPGGWLAFLRNSSRPEPWSGAVNNLMTPEYGANFSASNELPRTEPPEFYFQVGLFERLTFAFTLQDDWPRFFGSLLSASFMPDETHPFFGRLEAAARAIFECYSVNGFLPVHGETELSMGRPWREG